MHKYGDVLVSVIIPVYNTEQYLRRCVDSIRAQTYRNLEIILIDDGSPDNCPELCDSFAALDDRIVVVHQENSGQSAARNKGLDIMRGDWLCFVDSDDFILPVFVETLLQTALKNDCQLAQCRLFYEHQITIEQPTLCVKTMNWRDFLFYTHLEIGHLPSSAVLNIYCRSLFVNARFENYKRGEDNLLMAKLVYAARKEKFAVVNQYLYCYCDNEQSITRSRVTLSNLDSIFDSILVSEAVLQLYDENNEPELYDIYLKFQFRLLVQKYLLLMRDIPEQYDKFAFIAEKIKSYYWKARKFCHETLTIHCGAQDNWSLISEAKNIIIYGYGNNGKNLLLWCNCFKLPVAEIWDRKAVGEETVNGLPFRQAYEGFYKEVTILISIEDQFVAMQVQKSLREMGYKNFIHGPSLSATVKYAQYARFLPFLL